MFKLQRQTKGWAMSSFLDTPKISTVVCAYAPVPNEAAFPGRRDVADLSRLLRAPKPLEFPRPSDQCDLRLHNDAAQADHLRETGLPGRSFRCSRTHV